MRAERHLCRRNAITVAHKFLAWATAARARWLVAFCLLAVLTQSAAAHRSTPVGSKAGLSIPNVSHGQMVVLADNRAAIMRLTEEQYPTDSDMRRLQAFVNLQYFYCGWGLFPGSLTEETSPFNECAHAYLAGVRALLLHLENMPGNRSSVRALNHQIDVEMLDNSASMVLCRFSAEPFNSADVIIPHLASIFGDATSLAAILLLACGAAVCGGLASMAGVFLWQQGPSDGFDRLVSNAPELDVRF